MKDKFLKIIKKSAIFLLLFFTIILIFTTTLWMFKISISKIYLPIEYGISIIAFIIINYVKNIKAIDIKQFIKKKLITNILSIILATIIFILSVYAIGKIYDTTSDGNTYHKLAVGSMKNGWNPLYESCIDYTKEDGNVVTVNEDNINYLWVDHYAIGTEIIGANIYAFTNNIESGKISNLIFMYICFGIVLEYLSKKRNLGLIKSIIIAMVLVLNPVFLTQVGTYYVDTTLAMSLFISFIELLNITDETANKKNEKLLEYLILSMSIIVCINTKFTGLAYEGLFCGAFYIFWLIRERKDRKKLKETFITNTIFYIIVLLIAIGVVGCSSYLMNLIKHKSLFYPLSGENHVANMVNQEIPKTLSSKSHLEQFLTSIFSKGKNVSPAYAPEGNSLPEIKIPFTMTMAEINNYNIPDIRMGGFGPLFSGIFIIGFVITIYIIIDLIKNKKYDNLVKYTIFVIVSTLLVTMLDGAYWARYIPYIYFIQVMNLCYLLEKNKIIYNVIGTIFGLIMITNIIVVMPTVKRGYKENSNYVKEHLQLFKEYAEESGQPVKIKLNAGGFQGVEYNIADLDVDFIEDKTIVGENDGFMFRY